MAGISELRNYLGGDIESIFLSPHHILYNVESRGTIQDANMDAPNVDEFQRRGTGVKGFSYQENQFTDQPFSMVVNYQYGLMNRFQAIATDQNPNVAESEVSGSAVVGIGGEIGLSTQMHNIRNQVDRNNTNYVQSAVFLKIQKMSIGEEIPLTGTSATNIDGSGYRGFRFNKPAYLEGWGTKTITSTDTAVEEQDTPDDTALVKPLCAWLRRATMTSVNARKVYYGGGSSGSFSVITGSPAADRIDALVLYETSTDGYSDLALTIVEGTSSAPADADIDTAIDAIVSGSRWCRLANVTINSTETATVEVETADISIPTRTAHTLTNTALAIPTPLKDDSLLSNFDYAVAIIEDGSLKDNTNNISATSSSAVTYSTATSNMVEVIYLTEPLAIWNPLNG